MMTSNALTVLISNVRRDMF